MTPKRAEQIRQEIIDSGGWGSKSITKKEDQEIMGLWAKLDGRSTYYEAVCRMARNEPDLPSFLGGAE